MANGKYMTFLFSVLAIAAIVGVVALVWSLMSQPTAQEIQRTVKDATTASSLTGKPGTLSVRAIDKGNDDTQIAAPGAICSETVNTPVTSGDGEITCGFLEEKDLTASGTTDFTAGINVGNKYVGIASNATTFGFPTNVLTVGTQSDALTLETYSTGTHLQITMRDDSDTALSVDGSGQVNFTLAGDEAAVLNEIKLKLNSSNVGVNLAGFYFDKVANSNISTIELSGSGQTDGGVGYSKASLGLERTEADDIVFLFDSPILMTEQDTVTISDGIKVTTDSDGCASTGENLDFYALDRIWIKSSKVDNKYFYAYETDASSPADTGMTDPTVRIQCTA